MNKFAALIISFVMCIALPAHSDDNHRNPNLVDVIRDTSLFPLSHTESRVRNAAVKVMIGEEGHGSGTYLAYKNMYFILTAAHVAIESQNPLIITEEREVVVGKVIYIDNRKDIALILVPKLETKPIKLQPSKLLPQVGTEITYSGFPSAHNLLTFRGYVIGFEESPSRGRIILIHSYGWPGISGSGVFDAQGNLLGVAFAIDADHRSSFQLIEDIVWVSPIGNLDIDQLMTNACKHHRKNPACVAHKQKEARKRFQKVKN